MAVLIIKKPGSVPFTKRPTGSMRDLVIEAKAKYHESVEMIVAWVDSYGQIQVEPVQDIIDGHSACPVAVVPDSEVVA